jgi:hypothetical protein
LGVFLLGTLEGPGRKTQDARRKTQDARRKTQDARPVVLGSGSVSLEGCDSSFKDWRINEATAAARGGDPGRNDLHCFSARRRNLVTGDRR